MSRVLEKYREDLKKAEALIDAYRQAMAGAVSQSKSLVKGEKDIEKKIALLVERIKTATDVFQVRNILKDFTALQKLINAAISESGGGNGLLSSLGSIFGAKEEKQEIKEDNAGVKAGSYPLIDSSKEALIPYIKLLESFSKGTLLLADDDQPFVKSLDEKRRAKFRELQNEESDDLARLVYTFLFHKSNEAQIIEREREELKSVITSLTRYIHALAVSSEKFGVKIHDYSQKIADATSMEEIKKVQHAILTETLEIQKVNKSIRKELTDTNKQLKESSERISKLENELEMARQEKSVDALTSVYNRGYLDERLKEALVKFERDRRPCCLALFDIDHFKQFNDTYGHQVGDQVLKVVARIAKETVRSSDTVARYGGEEFALILYESEIADGFKVANNVRTAIGGHEFGIKDKTIHVTVSVGVTQFRPKDNSETVIGRSDKALYQAKDEGRNKTVSK